jgi:MFS family permease
VIAAADMLLQVFWIRNIRSLQSSRYSGSFRQSLTLPILILAAAECIGGSVFWSSAAWTPTLLRTAKSLSLEQTGWVMGILSLANMLGSFTLGFTSDKFGRKKVIAFSAFPAAAAAFVVFYWLDSPLWIAIGIIVFGTLKASVPALVVALAQEAAPPGNAGSAAGIVMSLHYTAGVIAPLIAAHILSATGDIVLAMIWATTAPLVVFGCLICAVKERARR